MKYPTRIYYTKTDKALMWDPWQKGESLNSMPDTTLTMLIMCRVE